MLDRRQRCFQHALRKLGVVERLIAQIGTELRLIGRQTVVGNYRREIELLLAPCISLLQLDQVNPSDQLVKAAHTELRHALPNLLGHEAEEVDDHLRQPDEVLAAQHVVLCRNARGAVVEVANAQVFAAQGNHGPGAEAEALGAQHRGLDYVATGLEAAVDLARYLAIVVVPAVQDVVDRAKRRIEDVLKELKQEMTIILVTNLVQQARRLADRTAFFLGGKCVEVGVTEDLFTGEVQDQRTRDYVEGRFG